MLDMRATVPLFQALADETRLRILALLGPGELCVCDLMAALQLPQSTVSRHLAVLRNAGWVSGRRQGVWMYYRLLGAGAGAASRVAMHHGILAHLEESTTAKRDRKILQEHLAQKPQPGCGEAAADKTAPVKKYRGKP